MKQEMENSFVILEKFFFEGYENTIVED